GDAVWVLPEPLHAARASTSAPPARISRGVLMGPSWQDSAQIPSRTAGEVRGERAGHGVWSVRERPRVMGVSSPTVFRVSRTEVTPTSRPARTAVASRTGIALGVLTAVLAGAGVWFTWRVFVATAEGQRVDQAAMDGAQFGRTRLWQIAEPVLEVVSIPALGLVPVAAMTPAGPRRRWMLALQIAVLVVGANLSTQLLKYLVLDRPDLGVTYHLPNALPSGHTTAAASVAVAAILVVPPRVRPYATVVGAAYAGLTGVSTLIGQWHRPSDVVAGLLVVLAWCGVATAMSALGRRSQPRSGGARRDGDRERDRVPTRRFSTASVVVVTGGYLLAVISGAAAWTALEETRKADVLDGRAELLTA